MTVVNVDIVVLNWNGLDDTRACLQSLTLLEYPSYHVIVVDNGSEDGSYDILHNEFQDVEWICLESNRGFVGGNNAAFQRLIQKKSTFVLLLNNDTVVAPDFLTRLMNVMEGKEHIAAVGPMIYYHTEPQTIWSAGGEIDWNKGKTRMVGIGEADRGQFGETPREVDFLTGCALLINVNALVRIGLLDERFFAYYEEVEWCVRASQHGYKLIHDPLARVWHKISPNAREASPQVHYYMTRNRLLFLKLSGAGVFTWIQTLAFEYMRTLLSWFIRIKWKNKKLQRQAMIQAIIDYFNHKFGKRDVKGLE